MEVYNVVIVEDEPHAARHIKMLVEKEDKFQVSAVYETGEAALEGLESQSVQADLLLTDIQMPGISGLNLIREIQKIRPGIPSIIISGYSSFQYAKEAISLGTMRYILKPIDVEELRTALEEVSSQIEKSRKESREQMIWKIQKDSEEAFDSGAIFQEHTRYRISVFALSLSTWKMLSATADYFQNRDYIVLMHRYCMILLQKESSGANMEEDVKRMMYQTCNETVHGVFVVGNDWTESQGTVKEIEKLYDILQKNFYPGESKVLQESEGESQKKEYLKEHRTLTAQLLKQAETGKEKDLKEAYHKIFQFFQEKKVSVQEMEYTFYSLVSKLYQLNEDRFDPGIENNRIICQFYQAASYEDAEEQVWKRLERLIQKKQEKNTAPDSGSEVFWKIIHFLDTNISGNYSLQEIAEAFHISQPYLSKLFRKYKGMSYKEYYTSLKVQMSVRLMEEYPEMLIKEIAERVGYEQLYFSAIFYRVMGEYPKQYRIRLGQEKAKS